MARLSALLTVFAALSAPALALWPQPRHLQTGSSALRLAPNFAIHLAVHDAPKDLSEAVARTSAFLKNDKLERLVVGRGAADAAALAHSKTISSLNVQLSSHAKSPLKSLATEARAPLGERDEAYTLSVPSNGSPAVLSANSTLGLFRGLTTFSQLWYYHNGQIYTIEAPLTISDSPAYPYRGLMLDTARNYYAVSDIERTIDAMSWVKINTFHWHVSDSQSFPLEVPGYEELAQKGAYSAASVYTAADVAHIVQYAGERGVDVLPEIDTPGHTAIIAEAHPDLVACAGATPWASFANEPPAGQLRITSPAAQSFTAGLLSAVAKMFPSALLSTGGDEINMNCYTQDAETSAALNASGQTFTQALDGFVGATHKAVRGQGKTPVVWEEMVLDYNVTLANDTVVMVWISSANAAAVAAKGFHFVHSASDYFYLDCGGGGWVGDNVNGNSWCDPFKTWQKSYSFDPTANLTAAEASLVLGGQHLLWSEQSGPANVDPIVWPRAASSAELYWSGPGRPVMAAMPRLHDAAYRFVQRGVKAIALQPEWCALRPGACDLTA